MNIRGQAMAIGYLLGESDMTIGVCESCTGGMLGSVITSVAGSSRYFKGGVIAYSDEVKARIVGVPRITLGRHGAVSREAAREMARGARDRLRTDIGISITGIAGPSGGSAKKPVGRVYIGIAIRKRTIVRMYTFRGTRKQIRRQACENALHLLAAAIRHGRLVPARA